jgi:Lectin C-type domain
MSAAHHAGHGHPFPGARAGAVVALLVGTAGSGACSIFTDLSELTRGTGGAASASGATSTTGTTSTGATGPAGSASSSGGSSGSSGGACSGTNVFADPKTGHCYFYDLAGSADRFTDARTKCQAWAPGADLAVIETTDDATFVFDTVNVEKDTWIGLSDQAVSGTYTWVTGAPLAYTDWDVSFPDDGAGQDQCIGFAASLKWANAPCGSGKLTLCERP